MEQYRDCCGRGLCCERRRCAADRNDRGDPPPDQIGRQPRQLIVLASGPAIFDGKLLVCF
jgi:hypothetical protein